MEIYNKSSDLFIREDFLGSGTYGEVWKVKSKNDGKIYALKLIERKDMSDSELKDIIQEINLMEKISKPHCKKYLSCFINWYIFKDTIGILMEYIDGHTLYELIRIHRRSRKYISDEQLFKFMKHILEGLKTLHDMGIAHNDIKPDNIIFNNHELKIVDFGMSCYFKRNEDPSCADATYPNEHYRAPELGSGIIGNDIKVWKKADIWSAGMVFYTLASLKDAFSEEIDPDLGGETVSEYLDENIKHLNLELISIISLCLEVNPKVRPTAKNLLEIMNKIEL